ncbi:MAG: radical SAM family heme chaperone HemW, partial [Clostridia bacterium]|nr:radical SAM family heme chaperone HemW [Clostridia bacterium]
EYSQDYIVDTLYVGGGTPTLLSNENLIKIANAVKDNFDCEFKEFSVEANPCTIDRDKLAALKTAGVTRISLGVQTFNDELLQILGRRHDSKQAKRAIKLSKDFGFDVSVDCMLGLPKQSLDDVKEFIETANDLNAEHISAYMLSVEDGTALQKLIKEGKLEKKSDDELAIAYEYAYKLLKDCGYCRYEVSNFCKNSKRSVHNMKYWQGDDYLGLGLSAHSLIKGERWRNSCDFEAYFAEIERGTLQRLDREVLSVEDKKSEIIMLSLRLENGLDIKRYENIFGEKFSEVYAKALDKNANYTNYDGSRLSIKQEYLQVMNSIVADFLKYVRV